MSDDSFLSGDPLWAGFLLFAIVLAIFAFVYQDGLTAIWVVYTKWQMFVTQYLELRPSVRDSAAYLYEQLAIRDARDITFSQAMMINGRVMRFSTINLVCIGFMLYLSLKIYKKERFEGEFSLEDLIISNRDVWPHLEFLSRVNPCDYSSVDGIFMERRFPIEYVRDYRLVANLDSKEKESRFVRFDRLRSRMSYDLGDRYSTIDKLPTIRRAMVAAFLVHTVDKPDADKFLPERQRIMRFLNKTYAAVEWIGDKKKEALLQARVETFIAPILNKHKDHPILKKAESEHGFELTVIMAIADQATKYGKFTPPAYPFLFPWDRSLFFALHELDYHESPTLRKKIVRREPKRGASVEAAAAKAHYFYETMAGRAFFDPMIDGAVDMFVDYLIETNVINAPKGYKDTERAADALEAAWRKHNAGALAHTKHGVSSVDGLRQKEFEGSDDPSYEESINFNRF